MFNQKTIKTLKDEEGQILVFVLVVVLILFMILFAVLANIRVDIQQVQIEREYESSYAVAEEELLKLATQGFYPWRNSYANEDCTSRAPYYARLFCEESDLIPSNNIINHQCCYLPDLGDDGESYVVVNRTTTSDLDLITLKKDEVLDISIGRNPSSTLAINWGTAPALEVTLICRDPSAATHQYRENKMVICRAGTASGTCGMTSQLAGARTVASAQANGGPLNMSTGCNAVGGDQYYLRIRPIGNDAIIYSIPGLDPNVTRMEIIDVRGFPKELGAGVVPADLPAPKVYVKRLVFNSVSPLFDYALYVYNGDVQK